MPTSLITAGDATSSATIVQGGNDGTLTLQTGPAGAKVNAIALNSAGQATLKQQPKLDSAAVVSMVRLNTANGYGSTNTPIRRFSNVVTNTGSDITYADSAANGASFTINTAGVYTISYTDNFVGAGHMGISLNSTQLTTSILSINTSDRISFCTTSGAGYGSVAAVTLYLVAGSIIRPHTTGSDSVGTADRTSFTITRVA